MYKARTAEVIHYQDKTNWHVLENKGFYLVKGIELSLVCTFAYSA